MRTARAWCVHMGNMQIMPGSSQRLSLRGPLWTIVLVSLVSVLLICGYIYSPQGSAACYIFSSKGCTISYWLPSTPIRELTDQEIASRVVISNILDTPQLTTKHPKVAFMFLTPGSLPFEKLWEKFFQGHEGKFSIYVHSSKDKPVHVSRYFLNQDIRSHQVGWGSISMVDAERRLLATALKDPDNQHFVLLSESCIPLHKFDYVFNYLIYKNISFIDSFVDPGPHGSGRYIERMLPEVEKKDFRKGAQWFSMKRHHALIIVADSLYYSKFRDFCKHGIDGQHCIADEHYIPTFFNMMDPNGVANWSVTYVDWSERKWHPRTFRLPDVNYKVMKNLRSIDVSVHLTSDEKKPETTTVCTWNGISHPCYLFARKFHPETVDKLVSIFSNYTTPITQQFD